MPLRSRRRPLARLLLTAPLLALGLLAASAEAAAPLAKPLAGRGENATPANGIIVRIAEEGPVREAPEAATAARERVRERLASVARAAGPRALHRTRALGSRMHLLDFGGPLAPREAEALAARLAMQPGVAWAVPNRRERRLAGPPNDPGYADQWWLHAVSGTSGNALPDRLRGVPGFLTAWSIADAAPAATVAVLDTGITCHEELGNLGAPSCIGGHVLPGYDFVSDAVYANDGNGPDADPQDPGDWVSQTDVTNDSQHFSGCTVEDSSWHGTDIAGLIAALTDNGAAVAAANWDARILPVRVAGKCGADVADIVTGIHWAAGLHVDGVPDNPHPARILNISFGGDAACGPEYQAAIDAIAPLGAVVVAAAGNDRGAVTRPANCPGAIGVGAVNRDGFKANYSSFGPELALMTVGGDPTDPSQDGAWAAILGDSGLLTIDNNGRRSPGTSAYARLYGTSFSTPLVSAALSLMLGVNPNLTAAQMVQGLERTARPHVTSSLIGACSDANPGRCICTTSTCGAGLLDVEQALLYASNPAAYVAPARQAANIDSAEVQQAVALAAQDEGQAASNPPPTPAPGGGGGDSGGGAFEPGWLAGLALAVLLLRRLPPRTRRAARPPSREAPPRG